jgi:hypothetical protein
MVTCKGDSGLVACSRDNSLILNALLVSRRIRPEVVGSDVILKGDSVRLSDVVKNIGLYVDGRLSWRKQVSYVVSRNFSTLRLFYLFQRYTSIGILESILCDR